METKSENDFLTVSVVCQLAGGITRAAVHHWVSAGKLKAMRVGNPIGVSGGRMMLFEKSEVLRFLAERSEKRRAARAWRRPKQSTVALGKKKRWHE